MAYKKSEIPNAQEIGPFIKHYLQAKGQVSVDNGTNGTNKPVSPRTIKCWGYMLKRLEVYASRKKLKYIHSLSGNHLSDFINTGYKNTGNNSKRVIISYLNSFLDYAESFGACIDNEARRLSRPKYIRKESDYLNEQELSLWLDTIREKTPERFLGRNMLIASLLIFPALRVEELVSLEIGSMDIKGCCFYVKVKGGDIVRKPLSDESLEYLAFWIQQREEKGIKSPWVFYSRNDHAKHITTRAIENLVAKYLQQAGIIKQSMGPHLIRHSGGSYLLRKGADIRTVQKMLGHKKITTTERYVHAGYDDIVAAGVHLNGLFGKNK